MTTTSVSKPGEVAGLTAAFASMLCATLAIAALMLSPDPGDRIAAIVFPPGTSADESLQMTLRLGGAPLSVVKSGPVVIADFAVIPTLGQLWRSGALAAVNPLFASGCSPTNRQKFLAEKSR